MYQKLKFTSIDIRYDGYFQEYLYPFKYKLIIIFAFKLKLKKIKNNLIV